jgi:tellurite methyltransferase
MTQQERQSWNRRYREGSHPAGTPDQFLLRSYQEFIQPLFPRGGVALDVAGGAGRHSVWLAERGWRMTLLDISDVGVAKARRLAEQRGLELETVVADTADYKFGRARFDLILVLFYLERTLFPKIARALRPGGLLVYKTYTHEQPKFGKRPTHPMHFLGDNELLHAFPKFRVLYYRETLRDRAVAEFVGHKM